MSKDKTALASRDFSKDHASFRVAKRNGVSILVPRFSRSALFFSFRDDLYNARHKNRISEEAFFLPEDKGRTGALRGG